MGTERAYVVYILASRKNGTIYVGVTGDLVARIDTHRSEIIESFTRRYGVHRLVWFEQHGTPEEPFSARSSSRSGTEPGKSR